MIVPIDKLEIRQLVSVHLVIQLVPAALDPNLINAILVVLGDIGMGVIVIHALGIAKNAVGPLAYLVVWEVFEIKMENALLNVLQVLRLYF